MKISKRIITITLALPILLGSISVFAGHHEKRKGHEHHHHMMKFLFKDIELTQDQKEQMVAFHRQERQIRNDGLKDRIKNAQETQEIMQEFMLADYFNEAAVRSFAIKMADEQIEARVERIRRQNEMYNILTAEQKQQVRENMNSRARKAYD